jgi:hypothetical protein
MSGLRSAESKALQLAPMANGKELIIGARSELSMADIQYSSRVGSPASHRFQGSSKELLSGIIEVRFRLSEESISRSSRFVLNDAIYQHKSRYSLIATD